LTYILTHPGSAHKDDFLACSVLAAEYRLPIHRREPTEAELENPEVCVVDVGGRHEPEHLIFDHHQFPSDHPPVCALSLVLQHLNLYEDARQFCPWLETAEWLDARGARRTAEWLGVDPLVVTRLSSPVDFSLLRYFAAEEELPTDHPVWQLMARIGGDLLDYLRSLRRNLDALQSLVEYWQIGDIDIAVLPRSETLSPEVAGALNQFVREQDRDIAGTVSPDKRGSGYGCTRFDDDQRLDFTRITDEEDVHFAHKQGFVAKTSATDPERLKALLEMARTDS
jgi:hypothetical protein